MSYLTSKRVGRVARHQVTKLSRRMTRLLSRSYDRTGLRQVCAEEWLQTRDSKVKGLRREGCPRVDAQESLSSNPAAGKRIGDGVRL